ncbi:hypothetical protein [Lysobacter firmicutimachus]|uniref:Uncharacterized protein n=1 Tax=Lysobacter firmicutimachus TaxID=1792846 RepID=A0ABU8CZS4_9GAMM
MKSAMLAATLCAFAFAAAAQTPTTDVAAVAQDAHAGRDAKQDAQTAAKPRADDRYCLRQTGSRIQSRAKQECAAYGRRYDRDDLQRTGEVDVASALRKLDPSVR